MTSQHTSEPERSIVEVNAARHACLCCRCSLDSQVWSATLFRRLHKKTSRDARRAMKRRQSGLTRPGRGNSAPPRLGGSEERARRHREVRQTTSSNRVRRAPDLDIRLRRKKCCHYHRWPLCEISSGRPRLRTSGTVSRPLWPSADLASPELASEDIPEESASNATRSRHWPSRHPPNRRTLVGQ